MLDGNLDCEWCFLSCFVKISICIPVLEPFTRLKKSLEISTKVLGMYLYEPDALSPCSFCAAQECYPLPGFCMQNTLKDSTRSRVCSGQKTATYFWKQERPGSDTKKA